MLQNKYQTSFMRDLLLEHSKIQEKSVEDENQNGQNFLQASSK